MKKFLKVSGVILVGFAVPTIIGFYSGQWAGEQLMKLCLEN